MSDTKFKAGDKVVRTEAYVWNDDGEFMQVGREYLVVEASEKVLILKGCPYNIEYSPKMFKLGQAPFKNMKFRVYSPEHSKEIQEALFEMGYKWNGHCEQSLLEHTNFNFTYTDEGGSILHGSWEPTFNQDTSDEFTVETTKSYKLIPVVIKVTKETVTIDGKTYDKEAILKLLAELEAVKN